MVEVIIQKHRKVFILFTFVLSSPFKSSTGFWCMVPNALPAPPPSLPRQQAHNAFIRGMLCARKRRWHLETLREACKTRRRKYPPSGFTARYPSIYVRSGNMSTHPSLSDAALKILKHADAPVLRLGHPSVRTSRKQGKPPVGPIQHDSCEATAVVRVLQLCLVVPTFRCGYRERLIF